MKRVTRLFLIQILVLFLFALKAANASPYIEAGTSIGKFASGDTLTEQTIGSVGYGFVGSFSLYFPITPLSNIVHLDLGIQNRFTTAAGETARPLMITPNIAARIEFWRFFVGAGYSPKVLVDMKPKQGASSYFFEGGVIWRVVPELQICAAVGLEYGRPTTGGLSPSPSSEYGLRFRFPLSPRESTSRSGVDFDGFRYPFGIMK